MLHFTISWGTPLQCMYRLQSHNALNCVEHKEMFLVISKTRFHIRRQCLLIWLLVGFPPSLKLHKAVCFQHLGLLCHYSSSESRMEGKKWCFCENTILLFIIKVSTTAPPVQVSPCGCINKHTGDCLFANQYLNALWTIQTMPHVTSSNFHIHALDLYVLAHIAQNINYHKCHASEPTIVCLLRSREPVIGPKAAFCHRTHKWRRSFNCADPSEITLGCTEIPLVCTNCTVLL